MYLSLVDVMVKRKATTFRLDERVLEAITKAARISNDSKNRYIEKMFVKHCQSLGVLPMDFEPLGETRGGDTTDKIKKNGEEVAG